MRPVQTPEAGTYDPAPWLAQFVNVQTAAQTTVQMTRQAIVDRYTDWVQEVWLPANGRPTKAQKEQGDFWRERLGTFYRNAFPRLLQSLGPYCSYCDSSMFSAMAVEHRVPKAPFPELIFRFDNFLLACPVCNSAKGDRPNQVTLQRGTADAIATIWNVEQYAWPDRYPPRIGPGEVAPFSVRVSYQATFLYQAPMFISAQAVASPGVDERLLMLWRTGQITVENGLVWVARGADRGSQDRGTLAITLEPVAEAPLGPAIGRLDEVVRINRVITGDRYGQGDRRIEQRTLAWLVAMQLRQLQVWSSQAESDGNALADAVRFHLEVVLEATGQWALFQNVFGTDPGAVGAVNGELAGTFDTAGWSLPWLTMRSG